MKKLFQYKQTIFLCVLSLGGFFLSSLANASPLYSGKFYCSILQYQHFSKNVLRSDEKMLKNLFGSEKNRSFIVDAKNGQVDGVSISNTDYAISVIDDGRQEGQAVKIMWRTRAGYAHAAYLEIHRYVDTVEKPFILVRDNAVISGTCQ